MLYAKINDKSIKKIDYPELKAFFIENAFMAFMNYGKDGFRRHAAPDMVDHFDVLLQRTRKECTALTPEQIRECVSVSTRLLMDNFIQHGSKGIEYAIDHTFQLVFTQMRGPLGGE